MPFGSGCGPLGPFCEVVRLIGPAAGIMIWLPGCGPGCFQRLSIPCFDLVVAWVVAGRNRRVRAVSAGFTNASRYPIGQTPAIRLVSVCFVAAMEVSHRNHLPMSSARRSSRLAIPVRSAAACRFLPSTLPLLAFGDALIGWAGEAGVLSGFDGVASAVP